MTSEETRKKQEECTVCLPIFDEAKAKEMSVEEIRAIYPRFGGQCPACGFYGVRYASYMHYIMGDY